MINRTSSFKKRCQTAIKRVTLCDYQINKGASDEEFFDCTGGGQWNNSIVLVVGVVFCGTMFVWTSGLHIRGGLSSTIEDQVLGVLLILLGAAIHACVGGVAGAVERSVIAEALDLEYGAADKRAACITAPV